MSALEEHSGLGDAGSKACSKCRVLKPMAGFFKDKSKPDGLYSQVSLRLDSAEASLSPKSQALLHLNLGMPVAGMCPVARPLCQWNTSSLGRGGHC